MEHELTCMLVRGIKLVFNKCPNYPLSISKKLYFRTLVKPGLQVYLRDWRVSKGLSFCFGGRAQNPPSCFFIGFWLWASRFGFTFFWLWAFGWCPN